MVHLHPKMVKSEVMHLLQCERYTVVSHAHTLMHDLSLRLRDSKDVVMLVLSKGCYPQALAAVSERMKRDHDVCLQAMRSFRGSYTTPVAWMAHEVVGHRDFFVCVLDLMDKEVNSAQLVVSKLEADLGGPEAASQLLSRLDRARLSHARDMLKTAKRKRRKGCQDLCACTSRKIQGDRALMLRVIRVHGFSLEHVQSKLRNDRELVLMAIEDSGNALM